MIVRCLTQCLAHMKGPDNNAGHSLAWFLIVISVDCFKDKYII